VLLGAGFAYLQFQQQQQASHDTLISNQVSKGFEQLGGDKLNSGSAAFMPLKAC
jgi:hypothetical protein